jgi:hypothetical protein
MLTSHNTHTLTPMNTRTQTIPLWATSKDLAPVDLEILEVTIGGVLPPFETIYESYFVSLRVRLTGHYYINNMLFMRYDILI